MLNYNIRACTQEDIGTLVEIIRKSFRPVAGRFGLTPENAPRHPSNCTDHWIKFDMDRGVVYFVAEDENQVGGCVAVEKSFSRTCFIERLGVLPEQRGKGLGKALINHALSKARELGAENVSIGIISQDTEMKDWYKKIGFVEKETKEFLHLPFQVTFMSYKLK